MEVWDGYKEDGTLAGCDLIRGKSIPKGLFHLVSEVIVRHVDGSYLVMQRSYKKTKFPGLYEAGASGAVLKGETAIEGAKRELREETGIIIEKLREIYKCKSLNTIYHIYLCETNCTKNNIKLQNEETISYMWLTKDEFIKFIELDSFVKTNRERLKNCLDKI